MSKITLKHKVTGKETTMTEFAYKLLDETTRKSYQIVSNPIDSGSSDDSKDKKIVQSKDKYEIAKVNAKRLTEEGSFQAAIDQYEKAKELNPKAVSWLTKQINALEELLKAEETTKTVDESTTTENTETSKPSEDEQGEKGTGEDTEDKK